MRTVATYGCYQLEQLGNGLFRILRNWHPFKELYLVGEENAKAYFYEFVRG
jgi:hypothetical protein